MCKICTGCQVQRYCSIECQKKDWPNHRKYCEKMKLDDKNIVKRLTKKIESYKDNYILYLIHMCHRAYCIPKYTFSLEEAKKFMEKGSTDVPKHCEDIVLNPKEYINKENALIKYLPEDDLFFLVQLDGVVIVAPVEYDPNILAGYKDIKFFYKESTPATVRMYAGTFIQHMEKKYGEKSKSLMGKIITADGGVIKRSDKYVETKSYIIPK